MTASSSREDAARADDERVDPRGGRGDAGDVSTDAPGVAPRDRRHRLGARGEALARRHLEARGFEVLDANFRTRHGELDLVAADRRHLVFCEVKTRVLAGAADELGPFAAIGPRKRRQVRLMAREWMARRGAGMAHREELRFDAIGIALDRQGRLVRLDHLEAAF